MRITVKRDPGEARRVVDEIEALCNEHGLSQDIIFKFQLSMDELMTNVISYGFEGVDAEPVITVDVRIDDDTINVVIRDNGRPFNPLADATEPDLDLDAEHRPIGGLGIHLTKAFIHTLAYDRADGFNCLSLTQPLAAADTDEPPEGRPDEH